LSTVRSQFNSIPDAGSNANSPIPAGQELDIAFEIANFNQGPTNGATEFYRVAIGRTTNAMALLGSATQDGVRTSTGTVGTAAVGDHVASVYTTNINGLNGLTPTDLLTAAPGNLTATSNAIGGEISHQIAHTVSLLHLNKLGSTSLNGNPPIMGVAAIDLPNTDLVATREFALTGFNNENGRLAQNNLLQLVQSVGLRDSTSAPIGGVGVRVSNTDNSANFSFNVSSGTIDVTNSNAAFALSNIRSATIGSVGNTTTITGAKNNFAGVQIRQNIVPLAVLTALETSPTTSGPTTFAVNNTTIGSSAGTTQTGIDVRNDGVAGFNVTSLNLSASNNTFSFNDNPASTGIRTVANGIESVMMNPEGADINLSGTGNAKAGGTTIDSTSSNGATTTGSIGF